MRSGDGYAGPSTSSHWAATNSISSSKQVYLFIDPGKTCFFNVGLILCNDHASGWIIFNFLKS